ncbi:MAG: preprotein translocase subunit SecA [Erysipelotrichaceae bacterium]|nr:preprotein translocase subunit SecA [Erysipelotrichaceae bacterium]
MNIFKKLFDHEYKELKKFNELASSIMALDESYQKLSDEELKNKTTEFKERLKNGETLDDILVEAFATVREMAYRKLGEKAFFVQLVGGIAIHYGNIAELKTGEGKTLVTTFPAYLNALTGDGVHVVTVNEYLTVRNAEWMGPIYEGLGLTVGINRRDLTPQEKKEQYDCDILYTTNNELGFDYLRDNMVVRRENRVQRGLNYAIIDEVDSILIDEARTPLIISGGEVVSANLYVDADRFVKSLKNEEDYIYDEKTKGVTLTDDGNHKAESYFHLKNLYDMENNALVHYINQALRANYSMKKDFDYVVQDGEVLIVDPFTGRIMKGRQWSDGLHQAVEAKEGVRINQENKTVATITFQNLFRMYKKLSGMTGTAKTEEEEFRNIYNMYVISVPTNKPVARIDYPDLVYPTMKGKYKAIVDVIAEKHKTGQPILVGTIAVETSELISDMLTKKGIKHEVLNAKNHAREAEIISHAGEKGAVTIATNMAGRGTDIKLTDETKALGGLCVIGTERHESRRIDNQLRGRSGRQGDPGESQFFVSMEDELMVRFGTDRIKGLLQSIGFDENQAIRSKTFTKSLSSAQAKVEGNNFDMRKQLLEYDDVMNNQREDIYERRNEILDNDSIHETVLDTIHSYVSYLVDTHYTDGKISGEALKDLVDIVNHDLLRQDIKESDITSKNEDDAINYIFDKCKDEYENKLKNIPVEVTNEFEKAISLNVIDKYWTENINTLSHLREAVMMRGYGGQDPLRAYTMEGLEMYENMLDRIDKDISIYLMNAEIRQNIERKEVVKNKITNDSDNSATNKPKVNKSKIGRNDPCSCGSGKKYKNCCGK